MVYNPLAAKVALVAVSGRGFPVLKDITPVAVAVGMWESRRDFQGVWEGWKAGFMAFHAFHTPSFPWLVSCSERCSEAHVRAVKLAQFGSVEEDPV